MKRPNKRDVCFIILILLIIAVTCFIFGNSILSKEDSKSASIGIAAFLKRIIDPNDTIDMETFHHYTRKLAHFTEFFVLGALYRLALYNRRRKKADISLFLPLFAGLFTAVCDEFLQFFTERGSMVSDVVLDFAGSVCGIAVTTILICLVIKKQSNRKESLS